MNTEDLKSLVIWRFVDGKPGHENQSLGLCNALGRKIRVVRYDVTVTNRLTHLFHWLVGVFPNSCQRPSPDLLIGVGHSTHFALLAARRAYGGRAVVIMKPSLPLSLFDLVIAPEHDSASGENVLPTKGVMNTALQRSQFSGGNTLFLLGGESNHYRWDSKMIIDQVRTIVERSPDKKFILSDSRRTPEGVLAELNALNLSNLVIKNWRSTKPGWVNRQFETSSEVWVSEDSVSMVYESLSSGACVGLMSLERAGPSRIARGIDSLIEDGWVTRYQDWLVKGELKVQPGVFNEASRCADWMVDSWLDR